MNLTDSKFDKLVAHIDMLIEYYRIRELGKSSAGIYIEAHECLIKKSVLEDLMITAKTIKED